MMRVTVNGVEHDCGTIHDLADLIWDAGKFASRGALVIKSTGRVTVIGADISGGAIGLGNRGVELALVVE